jgi:deazaflavin-dependent oxidoreductase (nitroreductase family)
MAQEHTTVAGRAPRIVYHVVNPTIKMLLRSPLHRLLSGRLVLLAFKGRKSGKRYMIPVGYVQQGDTLLITTERPWSKNLRGGAPVRVRLRGQWRDGTATVISDEAGLRDRYRVMLRAGPDLSRIIGVALDANGDPNLDDLRRARERGYVVVEIALR